MAKLTAEEWLQLERLWEAAQSSPEEPLAAFLKKQTDCSPIVLNEFERLWCLDSNTQTQGIKGDLGRFADEAFNASSNGTLIGSNVGSYVIVRQIGQGGASTVFLGRRSDEDSGVEHLAAVKVLDTFVDGTSVAGDRFAREQRILSRIQHPFVAQYIDSGKTSSGRGFVILEYVAGGPITEHVTALNLLDTLELFLQVCMAVEYLHRNLIVHRDLKPSNIFVSEESGSPKLLDFGVAKLFSDDQDDATRMCAYTPSYASPEQIDQSDLIGIASDVYSLGVILYELTFGQRVWDHAAATLETRLEERRRLSVQRIDSTSTNGRSAGMNRGQLRDLRRVLQRSMAFDASQRYANVHDLANDLRSLIDNKPVHVSRPTLRYQMERFFARRRAAVVLTSVALVALLSGMVAYLHQSAVTLEKAKQAQATKQVLTDILTMPDPYVNAEDVSMLGVIRSASDQVSRNADMEDVVRADVQLVLGRTLLNLGDITTAKPLLDAAESTLVSKLGPTSPQSMTARAWNVECLLLGGDFQKALQASETLMADLQGIDEPMSPLLRAMIIRQHAALQIQVEQRFDAAAENALHAASMLENQNAKAAAQERQKALLIASQAFLNQTKYEEAEAIQRQLIDDLSGPEDLRNPLRLSAQMDLADTLSTLRKNDLALEWGERNLQLAQEIYGAQSTHTLAAMASLGQHQLFARQPEAAIAQLESAYRGYGAALGEENRITQSTRTSWVAALVANPDRTATDLDVACREARQALAVLSSLDSAESPDAQFTAIILARCLIDLDQVSEAQGILDAVYAVRQRTLPADHFLLLTLLEERAKAALAAEDLGLARELYTELLEAKIRSVGEDNGQINSLRRVMSELPNRMKGKRETIMRLKAERDHPD